MQSQVQIVPRKVIANDHNEPVDEIPVNSVYMQMRAARIGRNRAVIERLELEK